MKSSSEYQLFEAVFEEIQADVDTAVSSFYDGEKCALKMSANINHESMLLRVKAIIGALFEKDLYLAQELAEGLDTEILNKSKSIREAYIFMLIILPVSPSALILNYYQKLFSSESSVLLEYKGQGVENLLRRKMQSMLAMITAQSFFELIDYVNCLVELEKVLEFEPNNPFVWAFIKDISEKCQT